jgi:hypothetical protein
MSSNLESAEITVKLRVLLDESESGGGLSFGRVQCSTA